MSKAWSGGSTRQWRRIRAQVLEQNRRRQGGRCQVQIPGVCTGTATVVHHELGRAVTADDRRYLVPSCPECNLKIGDPQRTDPAPKRITRW